MMVGVLQDVEETQVDRVRLFEDDVQQRLGGFDWTISLRLNRLQLFQRQRVTLIHVASHDTCVQLCRQLRVQLTQYIADSCAFIQQVSLLSGIAKVDVYVSQILITLKDQ